MVEIAFVQYLHDAIFFDNPDIIELLYLGIGVNRFFVLVTRRKNCHTRDFFFAIKVFNSDYFLHEGFVSKISFRLLRKTNCSLLTLLDARFSLP